MYYDFLGPRGLQGTHMDTLKFGLFEKHTKFEKNLPHGVDKSADLLSKHQNHEEDFFKSLNFKSTFLSRYVAIYKYN